MTKNNTSNESTNRIESNRQIASINGIDESNQRVEPPNDPTRVQNEDKTTQHDHMGGLGRSWELLGPLGTVLPDPNDHKGGLEPLLGALGPSWDGLGGHLGTNASQDRKQDCPRPIGVNF